MGLEIYRIESFKKAGLDIPKTWEMEGIDESPLNQGFNRAKWLESFARGKAHPDDIRAITLLITKFKDFYYVKESIKTWEAGFEYIEKEEQYTNYLIMINMPFLQDKLEWGSSVRGAWFDDAKSYHIDPLGKLKVNEGDLSIFIKILLDWIYEIKET